jgi:hypothetical protein
VGAGDRLRGWSDGVLRRAVGIVVVIVGCAGVAPSSAAAIDPLVPGSHDVRTIEYSAGSLRLDLPGTSSLGPISVQQPLEGSITYPAGPGPWKVLLFLHGNHHVCIKADGAFDFDFVCPDIEGPGGEQIQTRIRNYAGYEYLAALLASQGYAVVAPSANTITSGTQDASPDFGATPRAEIIGATLDLMLRWNNGAGPVVPGRPERSVGTKLTGRLELEHIGLMGHSKGGEAVSRFLEVNAARKQRYNIDAVVANEPTDSANQAPGRRVRGTNWATLLGGCDGANFPTAGADAFERAKDAPRGRSFAKFQWLVGGANHSWYNTVWTDDDILWEHIPGGPVPMRDSACSPGSPTSVRLSPDEQRRTGLALIGGFMRRYVGGERGFDAFLQNGARLPRSACPALRAVPCGALVRSSYVAPAPRRVVVGPGARRPLSRNALGGRLFARGLSRLDWCDPDEGFSAGAVEPPRPPVRRCPGPLTVINFDTGEIERVINRSWTRQLVVAWNRSARLVAKLPRAAGDVSRFGTLGFRAAVNLDGRNPMPIANRARPATQRLDVVLRDRGGRRAGVAAERFSSALDPPVGTGLRQLLLNDVRIPLTRFRGVDLRRLAAVELRFGVRGRRSGAIQLADMAFQ